MNCVDRSKGVLIGLACGDRNGGPMRMAKRLGESLISNSSYKQADVVVRYLKWFLGPPHDNEKAFDTGGAFFHVFQLVSRGLAIGEASAKVQKEKGSWGVNAAHRGVIISAASFISDQDLAEIVLQETYITHANDVSYSCALAVNLVCRELIKGATWKDAVRKAEESITEESVKAAIQNSFTANEDDLSKDGLASEVLKTALYFLHHNDNFADALNNSIKFAGSLNYCPVLVGAIGGALYGSKEVEKSKINNLDDNKWISHAFKMEYVQLANDMSSMWS